MKLIKYKWLVACLWASVQCLCKEWERCRKWWCQSSPKLHVSRCTRWTRKSRWTSCTTWSAQDTRRAAKTPARCCRISCLFTVTKAHLRSGTEELTQSCLCRLYCIVEHFGTSGCRKLTRPICFCVLRLGRFRRTSHVPDGERNLGASWSGELRRRLCYQEQTGRIRQTDHLHRFHSQNGTRAQAVWPSGSELVWFSCVVGELSVNNLDPTSVIRIRENRLSNTN